MFEPRYGTDRVKVPDFTRKSLRLLILKPNLQGAKPVDFSTLFTSELVPKATISYRRKLTAFFGNADSRPLLEVYSNLAHSAC